MTELNTIFDKTSGNRIPDVWDHLLFISLAIVLIIAISILAFDLFTERSEYFEPENVAIETFKSYSQRLNAISEKYAKELEKTEKVN